MRQWANSLGQRAKTDKQDALVLARFVAERRPPLWKPPVLAVSELQSLLERKQDLEQMIQQEKNRQHSLAKRPQVAGAVAGNVGRVLQSLEAALQEIEQALKEHLKKHQSLQESARRLQSVPGVGKKNVLPLLVLLSRFAALTDGQGRAKSLVAYAGLDPHTQESGTSVRGRSTISRMGDPRVRKLLFMGALGGKRGDNVLRAFYERLVGRGKAKMVALVAASRKILVWAWAVYLQQTDFDPTKIRIAAA